MNPQLIDNVKILSEQGSDFETGFREARRGGVSNEKILGFHRAMESIRSGKLHPAVFLHKMRETQSTGDFPLLMADSLDRMMLQGYNETPETWRAYTQYKTNGDFRAAKLFTMDGGEGLNTLIPERAPYPEAHVTEGKYEVSVYKYGARFAYSFEAFINDDLGALNATPRRMGRKCRRTQEDIVTRLFATDAAKAAMFTVGNANKVVTANGSSTANPAFGVSGVLDAFAVLSRQLDTEGEPIVIQGAVVVYPAELEPIAMQIRSALELRATNRAGDSSNTLVSSNYLAGMLTWVPNYRLAIVAETNPHTGWFMFANPSMGRPALAVAGLRGHEQPEMYMKSPNALAIGGGAANPLDGDFDTDSVEYKVRQFFGGARIDPKAVVFSEGDGN